jgi:tripartite-type tricarboxylate transporter receptor subunit TctC
MKFCRRQFLHLTAGAAALPAVSRIASAQAYPTRPVRWIVGFPPGGGADATARFLGQWLSERLGQPFVIENRPGASSNLAVEAVLRAPADGYTLLFVTSANAVNTWLYDKQNFDFIRDIITIAGITRSPLVLEVNPSFPVNTATEFIAYAKANPATISLASYGPATTSHLAGELFKMMAGVNMLHVPYRGSAPMVTDLLSGHVQASFDNLASSSFEYIKQGKLRPLAVTSTSRSEKLPDVPALHELLPGFEASAWGGVGVRRGTPDEIVSKLNNEINAALADPKIKARFADLGASVAPGSPADFGKFLVEETEKWGKVIRAANIKPQ